MQNLIILRQPFCKTQQVREIRVISVKQSQDDKAAVSAGVTATAVSSVKRLASTLSPEPFEIGFSSSLGG